EAGGEPGPAGGAGDGAGGRLSAQGGLKDARPKQLRRALDRRLAEPLALLVEQRERDAQGALGLAHHQARLRLEGAQVLARDAEPLEQRVGALLERDRAWAPGGSSDWGMTVHSSPLLMPAR